MEPSGLGTIRKQLKRVTNSCLTAHIFLAFIYLKGATSHKEDNTEQTLDLHS